MSSNPQKPRGSHGWPPPGTAVNLEWARGSRSKDKSLSSRCKGVDVWLGEKEMRSKEIRDTYQLHITVPSGTPACSGMLQYSPSLLSVLQWLLCPLRTVQPLQSSQGRLFPSFLSSCFPTIVASKVFLFPPLKTPDLMKLMTFITSLQLFSSHHPSPPTFIKYFSAQLSPFLQLLPCHCFIPRSHLTTQFICAYASLSPPFSSVCLSHFFFLLPKPVSPSHFSPQYIVPLSTITMSKNLGVILDSSLLVVQSTCQSC